MGRVGIPSVTLTPAAPCSLTFVVGLLEWGSISDYNKLSNFILVSVQGHPRICLDWTTCCQMLALVADLEVIGFWNNAVCSWQRYEPDQSLHCSYRLDLLLHVSFACGYSCITFIWGLFQELTIKRAVFIAWPFCDMRRCNSSKVFKERAFNRNPVCFERRARGGALRPFDTSRFLVFWNNAVRFWQRYEPERVCTAHIDWTFCCKFHLLMEYSCITFIWGLFNELTERDFPSPKQSGFPPLPYLKHVGAIAESVGIHETANDFSKWKLDNLDWHQIQESPASLVGNCKMYSNISGKGCNSFCHSQSPES